MSAYQDAFDDAMSSHHLSALIEELNEKNTRLTMDLQAEKNKNKDIERSHEPDFKGAVLCLKCDKELGYSWGQKTWHSRCEHKLSVKDSSIVEAVGTGEIEVKVAQVDNSITCQYVSPPIRTCEECGLDYQRKSVNAKRCHSCRELALAKSVNAESFGRRVNAWLDELSLWTKIWLRLVDIGAQHKRYDEIMAARHKNPMLRGDGKEVQLMNRSLLTTIVVCVIVVLAVFGAIAVF